MYTTGIHAPVAAGGVEYVCGGETYPQRPVEKRLDQRGIEGEPRGGKTVGVHVATAVAVGIGGECQSPRQGKHVLGIV